VCVCVCVCVCKRVLSAASTARGPRSDLGRSATKNSWKKENKLGNVRAEQYFWRT